MKKTYIQPQVEVAKLHTEQMLAQSLKGVQTYEYEAEGDEALTRENEFELGEEDIW